MQQSKDFDLDKEIFLLFDNSPEKLQSIFGSTLYGAIKPILVSTKQTTGHYLGSIKEIYVTFLQKSTHFHFSIFSACCPFFNSLLPFIFLFYFLLYITILYFSAFNLFNLCQKHYISFKL